MNSLGKPETLIATGALAISILAGGYSVQQNNRLQKELDELKQHLATVIHKIGESQFRETHLTQLIDAINQLNNAISGCSAEISNCARLANENARSIETQEQVIRDILNALRNSEIEISFPMSPPPPPEIPRSNADVNRSFSHQPAHPDEDEIMSQMEAVNRQRQKK